MPGDYFGRRLRDRSELRKKFNIYASLRCVESDREIRLKKYFVSPLLPAESIDVGEFSFADVMLCLIKWISSRALGVNILGRVGYLYRAETVRISRDVLLEF